MGGTHTKKRRHGKIFELPVNIRKGVNDLLVEPTTTYDDIVAFLESEGYDIGSSTVGRYAQWFFNEVRETEMLREQAALLTSDPEKGLQLEKLTATMITKRLAMAMQEDDFDVTEHAKLIDAFAKLQRSSTQREQWSADIRKKTEKAVQNIEKKAGKSIPKDTMKYIREVVYGLAS